MPLVKIGMIKGSRTPAEIRRLADIVQQVILSNFMAPPRDRYQTVTQHEPQEVFCEDTSLGYYRTTKLLIIQVYQQERTAELKQSLYAKLATRLKEETGLEGGDLIVSFVGNSKEDWSFGFGGAHFISGEL